MFITLTRKTEVLVDTDKEREHLANVFKDEDKEAVERQLAILDALERGEFNEVVRLYDALPYSEVDECYEQEYTGLWMDDWRKGYGRPVYSIICPRIVTLTPENQRLYFLRKMQSPKTFDEVTRDHIDISSITLHNADIVEYRDGDRVKYFKHRWEQLDEFGNIVKEPKKQVKEAEEENS